MKKTLMTLLSLRRKTHSLLGQRIMKKAWATSTSEMKMGRITRGKDQMKKRGSLRTMTFEDVSCPNLIWKQKGKG